MDEEHERILDDMRKAGDNAIEVLEIYREKYNLSDEITRKILEERNRRVHGGGTGYDTRETARKFYISDCIELKLSPREDFPDW